MTVKIRPLVERDVDALAELAVLAWEPVFESFRQVLGPRIYAILYPDWQQRQREAVHSVCAAESNMVVYVADMDGAPVGFIACVVDAAEASGEVDLLAVHPAYQNHGIGTQLNTFVLDQMKASGLRLAVVATGGDPGHAPARRTYEKAGYTGLPLVRYYKAL